ncbi:MAG: M24 family metallopeptidase [bacterium]|jgi:Xaa-Pro aminopeptidase
MLKLATPAVVLASVLCAAGAVPASEYAERRQSIRKGLDGAVLVMCGNTTGDVDELRSGFHQEPNFYYLTGWKQPGAILLLTREAETFFLPKRDAVVERYTGAKVAAGDADARARTGFERVFPADQFEREFKRAAANRARVLTIPGRCRDRIAKLASNLETGDARQMLLKARAVKSPAEIEMIRAAMAVTMDAHRAAWRRIAPGLHEYQVAASMLFEMHDRNCTPAYAPIVASGANATVLHYSENSRRIENGDLVLMDVAAACGEYASDVTRTVPANGRFTPRQRELYLAVLGAERAAIAAVKPGATMQSINKAARDYLEAHGKLGKYLTHGISHGIGLEAHDAPSHLSSDPFVPGMVITIEPGVYIPEERIGIRIEDTVLVTSTGVEVLSAALPTAPDEIEKAIGRK